MKTSCIRLTFQIFLGVAWLPLGSTGCYGHGYTIQFAHCWRVDCFLDRSELWMIHGYLKERPFLKLTYPLKIGLPWQRKVVCQPSVFSGATGMLVLRYFEVCFFCSGMSVPFSHNIRRSRGGTRSFKYVLLSPRNLGKLSNLTFIFFNWVGSTT